MTSIPEVGDHLISPRKGYTHHGIYIGRERVIHYAGCARPFKAGPVEEVTLADFAGGNGYSVVRCASREFSREESVRRARSRLGENFYDAAANNCEQFVAWCILGSHGGYQDKVGAGVAAGAATALGTGAAVGGVSVLGVAAGLSGPGIMSGLAAIGGGAVAGIAVVAAVPALTVAGVLNLTLYKTNAGQPESEQAARRAGTATTAAVGLVGSASFLAAFSGLSGAGIASGLAGLGTFVPGAVALGGGAMVGGVIVAAALPAVGAGMIGYGVYYLTKNVLKNNDKRPQDKLAGPPEA